jgi:hypothetical protein
VLRVLQLRRAALLPIDLKRGLLHAMKIYSIAIGRHPFLCELAAYLDSLRPPGLFIVHRNSDHGDWRADIAAGPPTEDRPKPLTYRRMFLQAPAVLPSFPGATTVSALNYYPVGGGGLGWHTDSHAPGWRVYLARPLTSTPGLLYAEGRTYDDVPGLARAFHVSGEPCTSWHAVLAAAPRFSLGVRIRSTATVRALGLPA